MHLPRHTLTSHVAHPVFTHASFSHTAWAHEGMRGDDMVTVGCATDTGFAIARVPSLQVLVQEGGRIRAGPFEEPACGVLQSVPMGTSSLVVLRGGGSKPLVPPTKVLLWDAAGAAPPSPTASLLFDVGGASVEESGGTGAAPGYSAAALASGAPRNGVPSQIPPPVAPAPPPGAPVAELSFATPVVRTYALHVVDCTQQTPPSTMTRAIFLVAVETTRTTLLQLDADDGSWSVAHRLEVDTWENPGGVAALQYSADQDAVLLAAPGQSRGHVQLVQVPAGNASAARASGSARHPAAAARHSAIVMASQSPVAALAISADGHLLAVASQRGTLVRVWRMDASTAPAAGALHVRQQSEFRRGTDAAETHDLAFARDSTHLAVVSDKGTVHIFRLRDRTARGGVPTGARSVAQFHVPLQTYPAGPARGRDAAENREGAWARTRARVADLRAGAPQRTERVALAWLGTHASARLCALTTAGVCYTLALDTAGRRSGEHPDAAQRCVVPQLLHRLQGCHLVGFACLALDESDWA
ncbi:Phosphatidylinositol 3,5-bisphosphate-binding protein [Malassezia sp. CBS 17886]|nr:Phosphatidylinositol 3,5-bisphosphate-binding protein [Malassezia sp. CBS 17886]